MDFVVGIVGRPNVGKSSLFNALLGYRRTIVLDMPGTTVDEVKERVKWSAKISLIDSQGVFDEGDRAVLKSMAAKADVFIFVVDAVTGVTPFDEWVASELHIAGKPVLLAVNKIDNLKAHSAYDFVSLRFTEMIEVSAAHRRNMDGIREWCLRQAGETETTEEAPKTEDGPLKLALIGRPNSGKSTLMNQLCQAHVSTVSPIPNTTRDPVSRILETKQGQVRLVDTAGMRRPRSKKEQVEIFSIQASTRAIAEADVVFLLIACHEPMTDQDMRLLNLIVREGKPAAVLLNFWDRLTSGERKSFLEDSEFAGYLKQFKTLTISGLNGFNVRECMPLAFRMQAQAQKRVKTSRLNEVVERIVARNPPPSKGRHNFNILYASQVQVEPPTFVFFMNRKGALPPSYQRYLENGLRKSLGFKSQPIRIYFRGAKESVS